MATLRSSTNKSECNHPFLETTVSSSRQQKLAVIACCAILGLLLAASACSKQSSKSTLARVAAPAPVSTSLAGGTSATATQVAAPNTEEVAAKKKTHKKGHKKPPGTVAYSDPNSGLSFDYPRTFELASGEKAQPDFGEMGPVPMNFVQPGGVPVATVELPDASYPGTDFASAFFSVNVNHALSEQECPHFAFVDTSDADGEPIDAEKVKVGSTDMDMTSEFAGSATKQAEARYYHSYENGACYEYVLGLGTAGYGTKEGIKPVDRDAVFDRLEKILATVKVHQFVQPQSAE